MTVSKYRKPHPLFDPNYYLEQYPDVARSEQDPLVHFLIHGGLEGRQPHPDFDSAFYLATNPDVLAQRLNPLVHFLEAGAAEGRFPHEDFDPDFYRLVNPDVAASAMNPILHFATIGAAKGYATRQSNNVAAAPESFLPVNKYERPPLPGGLVDVIIPVYRGVAETKRCIESALSATCSMPFRVVVINDCSPEPELSDYLWQLARANRIVLIQNEQNQGFVRSANTGMQASDHDVVLLNSDTEVFGDWLDRLCADAYATEKIGTVTPFSNNATICSYPVFCKDNSLPAFVDLASLDVIFASVNAGRSVDIPSAVGFCMFIRRKCLLDVGLFDTEAFGFGYGEENDFCMRASALGWRHKLACDVFVHHTGSVSFQEVPDRQKKATEVLLAKHPLYPALIQRHIHADPANAFRIAATANRIRNSGKRVFLSISHAFGGGVAQHLSELMEVTKGDALWLNLAPSSSKRVILECVREGYQFSQKFDPVTEYSQLLTVLRACGVERVHVHHLMGQGPQIPRLIEELQAPFDFTFHDHYTICPQVFLTDEHGRYCGEPGPQGCDDCLMRRPAPGELDILSWRSSYSWVLNAAQRVIAPSVETATRIKRYCPEANVVAAEHPGSGAIQGISVRRVKGDEPLRIAVLGTMATHKGFELLQECAQRAERELLPLQFILIGETERVLKGRPFYSETGPYQQADLSSIFRSVAPHLVWFPGQCPETFSFTLSVCLQEGLPVAVHDIGALPERIGGREWSWVLSARSTAREWIEFLCRVRREHFATGIGPAVPGPVEIAVRDFYPDKYLQKAQRVNTPRSLSPLRIAAAVSCHDGGQIQACGYVRIIEPLTHPAVADQIQLTVVQPEYLMKVEADIVLVQRISVKDAELAERIVHACRSRGILLVYEIDDDLFHITSDHPEYEHYVEAVQPAMCLASSADAIIVSTEVLRKRMLDFNPRVFVLPNYLDDRLWSTPAEKSPGEPVRILYSGTMSHPENRALLGKAVNKLGALRKRIQIEVFSHPSAASQMGSDGRNPPDNEWFRSVPLPHEIARSHVRFVNWIQAKNGWHWGVAPLVDSEFNDAKSALKFLEYSALGLPSICSDGAVYGPVVRHDENGILVSNDPEKWAEALDRAATDTILWQRLRAQCDIVVTQNTVRSNAKKIKSVWRAVAQGSQMYQDNNAGQLPDTELRM